MKVQSVKKKKKKEQKLIILIIFPSFFLLEVQRNLKRNSIWFYDLFPNYGLKENFSSVIFLQEQDSTC